MSQLTALGEAPRTFGHTYERPLLEIERERGENVFVFLPLVVEGWRVTFGANDRVPTAEITLGLEVHRDIDESPPAGSGDLARPLRDWQLWIGEERYYNPEELLGSGRRVRITTNRNPASDNWCIFEGFIDKLERVWSGATPGRARSLKMWCTSTIIAADAEISQFFIGQWWRSRFEEMELREHDEGSEQRECVRVTALPVVFNPGARPNMHAIPINYGNDDPRDAYVFNNVENSPVAERTASWNFARILRYIQWAAVQPGPAEPSDLERPYDYAVFSRPTGLANGAWSSYGLTYTYSSAAFSEPVENVGPNLDALLGARRSDAAVPHLDRFDEGDPDNAQEQALLRTPADLSLHGMSVLEAFVFVCDQAGMVCWVEHAVDQGGQVLTYLRFAVRGDRCPVAGTPGSTDELDGPPAEPAGGTDHGLSLNVLQESPRGSMAHGRTCTTHGVYFHVKSDWDTSNEPSLPANPPETLQERTAKKAFKADGPTEGSISEDLSRQRGRLLLMGGVTEYEATLGRKVLTADNNGQPTTFSLVPGWQPDAMWPELDPNDPDFEANVTAAEAIADGDAFQAKYGLLRRGLLFDNVGTYWVLNEDGAFDAERYQRQHGPWRHAAAWEPYRFMEDCGVFELTPLGPDIGRGDDYWALRRRRFLNTIARDLKSDKLVSPIVEISLDNGLIWYPAELLGMHWASDPDRAAVRMDYHNPRELSISNGMSFFSAYIRNRLRVRVTANIQGDDCLMAWSPPDTSGLLPWSEVIERGTDLPRQLRYAPNNEPVPAAASDVLVSPAWPTMSGAVTGGNREKQREGLRLAQRMRDELGASRFAGQCTFPWLWRPLKGPVAGYRIGDEVLGIQTGDNATFVNFLEGRGPKAPAPRIIGITYRYSALEMTTTIQLETPLFGVNDVVGRPGVVSAVEDSATRSHAAI